jgi:hypothetical protein
MAAAGTAATRAHHQAVGLPTSTGWCGLPKGLIQQIADGTDVILLGRIPGKAISSDDSAPNASVNDDQPFS